MMVAWTLLTPETREFFRSIVHPDEATWERGRGWALTFGIVAYPYYCKTNLSLARIAKRTLEQIIS
jgi:aminoglycoside phosphotransferase (APT) family kinase protein